MNGKARLAATCVALCGWLLAGCAGPGPDLVPPAPLSETADGRLYDIDGDGHADYAERYGPDGRVAAIRLDADGDGELDGEIRLSDARAAGDVPHLLICLDSVPYEMVAEVWRQGRLRLFHPPSRVISPFPVMTDVCLDEFLGCSPSLGLESQYFDGEKLNDGYSTYVDELNAPWLAGVHYHVPFKRHWAVYLWPDPWFGHELRGIQQLFSERLAEPLTVGYCAGTSAIGAKYGRDGHLRALVQVDRLSQWLAAHCAGKVQITLMSDHGHELSRRMRIPIRQEFERLGYRVGKTLRSPRDVSIPEFGVVTYTAIYTRSPAAVARDVVSIEGMDLAAYREGEAVLVVGRGERARITRAGGRFKYVASAGDPLKLAPVLANLARQGKLDADGSVADRDLFDATVDHVYPDAVHRLWRAFHGLVTHPPDVLVSIKDGYYCGSGFMDQFVTLIGAHGNLEPSSSTAFVMTTAGKGPLGAVMRMEDLREALGKAGVKVPPIPPRLNDE